MHARSRRRAPPRDEAEVAVRPPQGSSRRPETEALERALESVSSRGDTALYNTLYIALREQAAHCGTARELSRRAIVLLTDGEDTASMVSDEQVIELARRAGVVVYPIGLIAQSEPGHLGSPVPAYFLNALGAETGGRAYFPKTLAELEAAYAAIPASCARSTASATCRSNARADGAWRRHRGERAAQRPRTSSVRHRTGYCAPAGEPSFRILPASARSSWRGSPRRDAGLLQC